MTHQIQHLDALEQFVASRICTAVVATGADGRSYHVAGTEIVEDANGLHFGPVTVVEDDVMLSQLDENTCEIVLAMVDGSMIRLHMIHRDTDTLLF
jgi:hypothetical protein